MGKQVRQNAQEQESSRGGSAAERQTARPANSAGGRLRDLQSRLGNRAFRDLVTTAPAEIRRQTGGSGTQPEEEEPFDTSGLSKQGKTAGHGNLGGGRRGAGYVQREGGGGASVTANTTFSANSPAIIRKPADDIASSHGKPGVAGWTTPKFNISIPFANPSRIDFGVMMDFDIELASEFTGDVLSVLQDHEMGHVKIGQDKGKAHLVDDLEAAYEGMPALSLPTIRAARDNAAAVFENEEGIASEDYDTADYPRMRLAYLGARTPLADLEARSGAVRALAGALRRFNAGALTAEPNTVRELAQGVNDLRGGVSADDLSQLQYNKGFKSLISRALAVIDEYIEIFHYDFWLVEFSTLDESTQSALDTLRLTLAGFTWRASV